MKDQAAQYAFKVNNEFNYIGRPRRGRTLFTIAAAVISTQFEMVIPTLFTPLISTALSGQS